MDLSQHVILPREDFIELQTAAWGKPPTSAMERVAGTAQATIIFVALAGAGTAAVWGWVKAQDWLEERKFQRKLRSRDLHEGS